MAVSVPSREENSRLSSRASRNAPQSIGAISNFSLLMSHRTRRCGFTMKTLPEPHGDRPTSPAVCSPRIAQRASPLVVS